MSDDSFHGTVVFGPDAAKAAAQYRAAGVPGVIECANAEALELPSFGRGNVTLTFAHRVPGAWLGEARLNPWLQALMEGTGIGKIEMGYPELRGLGNAEDDTALLMLHWANTNTATALKVARAIGRSYAELTAQAASQRASLS